MQWKRMRTSLGCITVMEINCRAVLLILIVITVQSAAGSSSSHRPSLRKGLKGGHASGHLAEASQTRQQWQSEADTHILWLNIYQSSLHFLSLPLIDLLHHLNYRSPLLLHFHSLVQLLALLVYKKSYCCECAVWLDRQSNRQRDKHCWLNSLDRALPDDNEISPSASSIVQTSVHLGMAGNFNSIRLAIIWIQFFISKREKRERERESYKL